MFNSKEFLSARRILALAIPSVCLIAAANPPVKPDGLGRVTGWSEWEDSVGGDMLTGSKLLVNDFQLNRVLESLGRPASTLESNQYVAVIAFAGERSSGGYTIEMNSKVLGDDLVVLWRVVCPPPGAITTQVLTRPWHLAAFLRPKGTVQVIQLEDRVLRGTAIPQ